METLTAPAPALGMPATKYRITSIDFLRGLVMVIMALDHVRDYFHSQAMIDDPTNLATTTPILFFTRWITHFCAPTFVFLAGTSAFLSGQRRTKKDLSLFLLTRGFWLILIEVTIVTFGWAFNPIFSLLVMQVIWAIGISMMLLGLLIWLPTSVIVMLGFAIVFGHNLFDKPEAQAKDLSPLWQILHTPRGPYLLPVGPERGILFLYAFPAWTGIMFLGYGFGQLYKRSMDREKRKKILLAIGLSAIALFFVLRLINGYGDRAPWSEQKSVALTVISFFNVTKYPPSLVYTLMTLGPSILFLAFFEQMQSRFARFFITFGRVPFFYYILHIYLIHILCAIAFFATGFGANDIVQPLFFFRPAKFGFNLWAVYAIWAAVILMLYPLCRWYEQYKTTHQHWVLSYL